jgi:hypothetical protein
LLTWVESKMKKKEKKPEALEKFFANEEIDESSVNN